MTKARGTKKLVYEHYKRQSGFARLFFGLMALAVIGGSLFGTFI